MRIHSIHSSLLGSKRGGVFRSALALLLFGAAAGTLGWMFLTPGAMRSELEARTGFPIEAEMIASNPLSGSLTGRDIRVGNPASFGGGASMLEIESLDASASVPALARGEIWIHSLDIRIKRATLVVDERGRLNLRTFVERLFQPADGGNPMPFYAESVHLVIDELTFVDNSRPLPTSSAIRPLLDVELRDMKDYQGIFGPIFELGSTVGSLPIDPSGSTLAR